MQSASHNQADLITISVSSARLKNTIYKGGFWLSIAIVGLSYAFVRDFVLTATQPAAQQQASQTGPVSSLLSTTMVTPKNNVSGVTFTVPSSRNIHMKINNNTGNKVVLNRLDGNVVCSYTKSDVEEDVYLEQGKYVISLVAKKESRARAAVEIR